MYTLLFHRKYKELAACKRASNRVIGDRAKVIVDSQFIDYNIDIKERLPRCLGTIRIVVDFDFGDEWAYQLKFKDGKTNWFKRYHL